MSTRRPLTPDALDDRPIPVQAKLAAAWTSFMFLYAYVDILGFYTPGAIKDILDGKVYEFDLSPRPSRPRCWPSWPSRSSWSCCR
jgi:hypothetical protein